MSTPTLDDLRRVVRTHWGFDAFRPLQQEAMLAALAQRDSLVVMPTGGGKSLCYQAPAVARGGTTVVVSPLISLMKDQVDGLQACGVSAVQIDSSLSSAERGASEMDLMNGDIRLLFVSPERLVLPDFRGMLRRAGVQTFAIDEAHCISHWGHDFRPEYRQMGQLKEWFPGAAVHAYTATATEQVRHDIARQLGMKDPLVLVGNFDRPNLTYRILPRHDLVKQVGDVLERHVREAGIIYCLRRADVDDLAQALNDKKIPCMAYHAGMAPNERRRVQEAFAEEKCDLIIATVAFGMGIDRSNIRFVIHAAMPKSIEHYQQETGRAGRDSLEAECVLLYSGADPRTWNNILTKSAKENDVEADFLPNALKHLNDMDRYARGAVCRHRALVGYFGQTYPEENCKACDICLGDTEPVVDAAVVAQKILSCVARVQERFGVGHVVSVLRGENTERIRSLKHDQLSTFGLCKEHGKAELRDWIFQLMGQGALAQTGDEYPVLKLTEVSWEVMKKQRPVRLIQLARRQKGEKAKSSQAEAESWEGVDRGLFEAFRVLRRDLAAEKGVPPFIVFSDATLRELARVRPSSLEKLHHIYGFGQVKLKEYGEQTLQLLDEYCAKDALPRDVKTPRKSSPAAEAEPAKTMTLDRSRAFDLFRRGAAIEEVMEQTQRARSTVQDYLADFIRREKPADVTAWVPAALYDQVATMVREQGTERLKPIFIALEEKVPYDVIRVVAAHVAALG